MLRHKWSHKWVFILTADDRKETESKTRFSVAIQNFELNKDILTTFDFYTANLEANFIRPQPDHS